MSRSPLPRLWCWSDLCTSFCCDLQHEWCQRWPFLNSYPSFQSNSFWAHFPLRKHFRLTDELFVKILKKSSPCPEFSTFDFPAHHSLLNMNNFSIFISSWTGRSFWEVYLFIYCLWYIIGPNVREPLSLAPRWDSFSNCLHKVCSTQDAQHVTVCCFASLDLKSSNLFQHDTANEHDASSI